MKIITISRVGYNHPSQANWSYGIWKIDLINPLQPYNMSYTVKETFGGDSRLTERIRLYLTTHEITDIFLTETKQVYTTTGTQKVTGVQKLLDIEGVQLYEHIIEFINK